MSKIKKFINRLHYRRKVAELHDVGTEVDLTPIDGRCFIGRHKFRNGADRCIRCNALRDYNA